MARRWRRSFGIATACLALLPAAGGLLYAGVPTNPCDRSELTASIGTGQTDSSQAPSSSLDRLTIVLVGDGSSDVTVADYRNALLVPAALALAAALVMGVRSGLGGGRAGRP